MWWHRILATADKKKTVTFWNFENHLHIEAFNHLTKVQYHHSNINVFQMVYVIENLL